MTTLRETLTAPATKPAVVADLAALVEGEVGKMGGLTGIAAKAAFGAAKKSRPDIVQRASSQYVGTLADALDPFWARFQQAGGGDFGAFLAENSNDVSSALQAAIDKEAPTGGAERGMYDRFKPQIVKVMVGALPKLGALVQKHAG